MQEIFQKNPKEGKRLASFFELGQEEVEWMVK